MTEEELEDLEYDYVTHAVECSVEAYGLVNMDSPTERQARETFASIISYLRAQAWEAGRLEERLWRGEQDDADAAGLGKLVPYPVNPYLTVDSGH